MVSDSEVDSVILDEAIEAEVYDRLHEHYAHSYLERVEDYLSLLLDIDHFSFQYDYLRSIVGDEIFHSHASLLVSGFGAGSEMVAARRQGFGKIFGVEIDPFLLEICQKRLGYLTEFHLFIYDGEILPFDADRFTVVSSSHVIEHTGSPKRYLHECMRVLAPRGYLLLEFPHRYHKIEQHTNLRSYEWLPRPMRNAVLRMLTGGLSPLEPDVKSRYHAILATNLQQISMGGVERMLRKTAYPFTVLNSIEYYPGIIRCVIQKNP